MNRMESNDSDLVELARAGEAEAFQQLVLRHSRRVFATAFRLTGSEADADDVVQETFLRAYRKLDLFDGRSRFTTWLHRITVNCAMDLMRKRSRHQTREITALELDERVDDTKIARPDRVAAGRELGRAVERVLQTLTPVERTTFVLRHFEGHSSREIGRMLHMRSGAVRNAVFRAVKKLRRSLEPMMERCDEAADG